MKAYEHIFQNSSRLLGWEAQQSYLEARYALAQIYLAQDDRTKAQETLAPLLELCKGADKNILLLKKAQACTRSWEFKYFMRRWCFQGLS
jgi:hypothetical protein